MAQGRGDFRSRCGGVVAMLGVALLAAQAVGQAGGAAAAGPGGGAVEPDFVHNWAAQVGFCTDQGSVHDFDPSAGTDKRTSAGGGDVFVTRLLPNGGYDGTLTFGDTLHDEGYAIAVDPVRSQVMAHAGVFGAPSATTSYSVDFDPGGGGAITSAGLGDAYVSAMAPDFDTSGLKNMVMIMLDNSQSIDEDEFEIMIAAYADAIDYPGALPTDKSCAIAIGTFGTNIDAPTTEENRATLLMPWTVIDPATANLFARRLRNHYRYTFSGTHMASGGFVADDAIRDTPLSDVACFRTIHIFADGQHKDGHPSHDKEMGVARDTLIASSFVDRIDGFAVPFIDPEELYHEELQRYINQEYLHGIVGGTPDPEVGVVATDGGLPVIHIAVETDDKPVPDESLGFDDPNLPDLVGRALIRAAYCPGDFNLDGEVDGDDWTAFQAACGIDPRADWDFDGDYNCDPEDVMLFQSSMNAGCCDE